MNGAVRKAGLTTGLLVMASAAALSQAPRAARDGARDGDGVTVMSDTQAWCFHFAAEVAALRHTLAGAHPRADMLAQEGRRLCGSGHVRLGITRLRYALMQLREH